MLYKAGSQGIDWEGSVKESMIRLNDKYVITIDERQYCLCKRTVVKTGENKGKENLTPFGYYPTLTQALDRFARQSIINRLKDANMSLSEAVRAIRESNAEVARLIKAAFQEITVKGE